MAKLPTRDDLGPVPSARSGRPIATVDTSAAAKGQIALGKSIAGVGEAGMDIVKHQQAAEDYETERKFQEFKWNEELGLEDATRNVEPGQAGNFAQTWSQGYKERAKGFLDGMSPEQRQKYDAKLFDTERQLYRPAATFARTEQKRASLNGIDDFKNNILVKSGNLDKARSSYEEIVAANPWLTPSEKDELRRKGLNDLEERHVTTLLGDRTKARDVLRDLGYGPEDAPEEQASKGVSGAQPGQPAQPRVPVRAFAAPVNAAIADAARKHGVDPGLLATFARIESSGRPGAQTGSYKGLFQLSESEFRKHGGEGDIFDADANADAAARKLKAEAASFELKHGRQPSALDLYLVHQQGEAGYASHMARPDAPAWQNMAGTGEGRQKGAGWAKQAIWGNIPDDMKKRFPDGVESVTSQDFIGIWGEKVARLGGGEAATGPRVASSPDTYSGPYRHLTAEDRLKHATAARVLLKQEAAEVAQDVRAFENIAEQGFAPKPGQMEALRKRVADGADAETRQSFMQAEEIVKWQDNARRVTPEELDVFVRSETERLRKGGATSFDTKRLAMADKLLTNMRQGLKSDPLGWADRIGMIAVQPVDMSTPETAQASLGLRVKQAEIVAQRYGLEPKYLRDDEKQALTAAIEEGGEKTLATTAMIASAAGEHAPAILSELSKNSPTAAIVGGMVTEAGMTGAARDAADGLKLRKEPGFESVAPPKKESRKAVTEALGSALSGMPKTETAIIDATNAIYEVRARKQQLTEFDSSVWQQALREVVGEREVDGKTYGGVVDADPAWRGARNIILPPFVAKDGWRDVIEAVTLQDLWQAGLGVPAGGDGQPVALGRVKGAILVQSGNGRYKLSLGDPDAPGEEKWIKRQDAPDEIYEIDLHQLRPVLSKRRPELFLGDPETPQTAPSSMAGFELGE